ncbi:MAG: diaminopimelate decarboxylase [Candidatus Promineifilaceae bacterium]
MKPFNYQDGVLSCEDVPLTDIAAKAGTPVYVYSKKELLDRARAYHTAAGEDALVCYAVKANSSPALLRLLRGEGLGADVTSGGELFLALHAGIPPQKIIYSGVGKRPDEIDMAISAGIGALHIESEQELDLIGRMAADLGRVARISIRVNPNISADTHPYDSTGRLEHKFGLPRETAVSLYKRAAADPWLEPVGVAAHIGSQISDIRPYRALAEYLVDLAGELSSAGVDLTYVDVGGGLAIDYNESGVPPVARWVSAVAGPVERAGYRLVVEPGRSIVGPAGALVCAVLYTKEQGGKRFVIVDAGMNDLVRPAMYNAYHAVRPLCEANGSRPEITADIVGPVCETGDFLARDRLISEVRPGELLALMNAGAYGFAMSSNYNGRLRPPEVLVDGADFHLIRRRQAYEHLLDGVISVQ